MTEEYMTSAELTREIADLKMRLALQIEYKKESSMKKKLKHSLAYLQNRLKKK